MLGLRMPGFGDLAPKPTYVIGHAMGSPLPMMKSREEQRQLLASLRPRAVAIDAALAGRTPPSPADYLKRLLTARAGLAGIIDYGSSVARVNAGSQRAVGWRFTGPKGMALTAVNVDDEPQTLHFAAAQGTWKDLVTDESFSAKGETLTVPVPPHGVRLLRQGKGRPAARR